MQHTVKVVSIVWTDYYSRTMDYPLRCLLYSTQPELCPLCGQLFYNNGFSSTMVAIQYRATVNCIGTRTVLMNSC